MARFTHWKKGFRLAWGNPFARTASLVLGLGLGFVVTAFTLMDQTLLRPVPGIPSHIESRLAALEFHQQGSQYPASFPLFQRLQQEAQCLDGLLGASSDSVNLSAGTGLTAGRFGQEMVTADYFQVLGVDMAAGRSFTPADPLSPQDPKVAVISHRLWQRQFGGSPEAVGMQVHLNGQAATLIGVAAPGFQGTSLFGGPDLWVPLTQAVAADTLSNPRHGLFFTLVGRLAPHSDFQHCRQQIAALASALDARQWWPGMEDPSIRCLVRRGAGLDSFSADELHTTFRLLFGTVALILLAAVLNAAGLLLSQSLSRNREWAVLNALGAGRQRILLQVLCESLALALPAGLAAALAAFLCRLWLSGLQVISYIPADLPFEMSYRVFLFSVALTFAAGTAAGLLPSWVSASSDPVSGLREGLGNRGAFSRTKALLTAAQMAASFVLVLGALLFLRSLQNVLAIDLGLRPQGVVSGMIEPRLLGYGQDQLRGFYSRLKGRLDANPAFESAALAEIPPFQGTRRPVMLQPSQASQDFTPLRAFRNYVTAGYLETAGLHLLQGRAFTALDGLERPADAPPVAILSASAADRLWPGSRPLGRRFLRAGSAVEVEVVGVVEDHRHYSPFRADPMIYEPLGQGFVPGRVALLGRGTSSAAEAAAQFRLELGVLEPRMALFDVQSLTGRLENILSRQRLFARLLPLLALAALSLAALGLWGLVAGNMRLRRREFGIRMALGARLSDLVKAGLVRTAILAAAGIAAGTASAALLADRVSAELYEVPALDPLLVLATAAILFLCALSAGCLPLRQIARIDPSETLRSE